MGSIPWEPEKIIISIELPNVKYTHDSDRKEEGDHGTEHVHRDVVLNKLHNTLRLRLTLPWIPHSIHDKSN